MNIFNDAYGVRAGKGDYEYNNMFEDWLEATYGKETLDRLLDMDYEELEQLTDEFDEFVMKMFDEMLEEQK